MLTQVCTICGEEKLITDFPKNGVDKIGSTRYRPDCKLCYGIKRKKYKIGKFVSNSRSRGAADTTYVINDWKECLIHFRGECAYCGKKQSRRLKLTKEHVQPVSKNGATSRRNIIPACMTCNCSKSDRDIDEWYPRQRFYNVERLNRIRRWIDNEKI